MKDYSDMIIPIEIPLDALRKLSRQALRLHQESINKIIKDQERYEKEFEMLHRENG